MDRKSLQREQKLKILKFLLESEIASSFMRLSRRFETWDGLSSTVTLQDASALGMMTSRKYELIWEFSLVLPIAIY